MLMNGIDHKDLAPEDVSARFEKIASTLESYYEQTLFLAAAAVYNRTGSLDHAAAVLFRSGFAPPPRLRHHGDGDEAKIHVAVAPVYYHNYVLGHLTAAQLRNHLEKQIVGGPFFTSELAGRYLLEVFFGQEARDNWEYTMLRATGERLNRTYFLEMLQ
jgi:hypothetical protein